MNRKALFGLEICIVASILLVGCMSTGVQEDEKVLLITIDDLAAYGIAIGTPTEAGEKYTARRFANGLTEIEYEYDSEKDPGNDTIVLFYSEADIHRNETLAITAFDDAVEAYLFGASLNTDDIQVVEVPHAFTLGEQNYGAALRSNGQNWGNLVVTRKGSLVYSFLLAGPHVRYQKTLHELIGPRLEKYGE